MNTTVAIIGANSFLARELINELISKDFKINAADYEEAPQWLLQHENLKWIKLRSDCLEDIKNVCEDVDTLFYLPHQSIRTQGFYTDHQLNFLMLQTHWLTSFANTSSIKKIIYVSSMMQKDDLKGLLFQNRFNMENILKDGKAPVIVLRLPLLLMNSSEDFEFILKTLKRYPFVFLPTWIEKQVQPIFVKDVVEILVQLQLDNAYTKINRNINLPGPNLISYFSFFKQIIKKYKLRCSIITTNLLPASFFYFFLSLFSRNTFSQIQRKFECWNQDAVVLSSDWKQKKTWVDVEDALKYLVKNHEKTEDVLGQLSLDSLMVFRSSHIPLFKAHELALEFFYWLQSFFLNLIRVEIRDSSWKIYFPQKLILVTDFRLVKKSLNEVLFQCDLSFWGFFSDKVLFHITLSQSRSRKFALFSFQSTRKFGFLKKLFIVFIMKRFLKFLEL